MSNVHLILGEHPGKLTVRLVREDGMVLIATRVDENDQPVDWPAAPMLEFAPSYRRTLILATKTAVVDGATATWDLLASDVESLAEGSTGPLGRSPATRVRLLLPDAHGEPHSHFAGSVEWRDSWTAGSRTQRISFTVPGSGGGGGGEGGSENLIVVSGGVVELDDTLPRGTLIGYDVTAATTFTTEAGSVVLAPGLWSLRRTGIGWNWKELPAGTAITPPVEGPDISDDFNAVDAVSINGRVTPVGSKAWVTPWVAGLGGDPLSITSNRVGVSSVGGAGRLLTDQQNYRASAIYDVTETSKQVRVYARAQASATNDSATSGVCVVLRGNGDLNVERGNDYFGVGQIGAGQPTTGILSIEVFGDTAKAFVNGVQVGATFSVAGINGAYSGLGFYAGGTADDFTIEYL